MMMAQGENEQAFSVEEELFKSLEEIKEIEVFSEKILWEKKLLKRKNL